MTARLFHAEVEGHRMAVLAFNEHLPGTPIVLIHGVLASANFWHAGMMPAVAQRRWYSIGLPAHFPSEAPPDFEHRSVDAGMFERLISAALQAAVANQPAILIGHSTGGFSALNLAVRQPERVKAVVSVGGFAQGPFNGFEGLVQKAAVLGGPIGCFLFWLQIKLTSLNPALCRWLSLSLASRWRDYLSWPHLQPQFRNFFPDTRQWDWRALFHLFRGIYRLDIRAQLSEVRCPVLVVAGTHDPVIPAGQPKLLQASIRHAEVAWLSGVGHMPFAEAPQAYEAAVTRFISRYVD